MSERTTAGRGARRIAPALAITLALVGLPLQAQSVRMESGNNAARDDGRFDLPGGGNQLVVRFTERLGELASDDYPTLRVFADGRVVSHRPAYMARQGDFTTRISAGDVRQLLASLSDTGILEFDSRAVRAATDEARRRRGVETLMTDPSTIEIEVRLAGYRAEKSAAVQRDFHKVVQWTGLRYDARTYPEIPELQNLAVAIRRLTELAETVERSGSREGGVR